MNFKTYALKWVGERGLSATTDELYRRLLRLHLLPRLEADDPDRITAPRVRDRVRKAAPELTTGRRAVGDTKSEAGKRYIVLPAFLHKDLRRHLDWYAEKDRDGLLFVGEKGAPFRRSSFGRKWRRARTKVGMPENFRFYDLRHTGHTMATLPGATLKDTMVRAGQSSEKAALIYQHSDRERQKEVAGGLDRMVRAARQKDSDQPDEGSGGAEVVRGA